MTVGDGLDTYHVLVSFLMLFQMLEKNHRKKESWSWHIISEVLLVVGWFHCGGCVMILNIMAAGESGGTKLLTSWWKQTEQEQAKRDSLKDMSIVTYFLQADLTSSILFSMSHQCISPLMILVPQDPINSPQFLKLTANPFHSLGEHLMCKSQ